jgi:ABC-type Na+ transport system ATPase subunit NatA
METFDEAIALRPAHSGRDVFDALKLQKQFVGMEIRSAAIFASIISKDILNDRIVVLKKGWTSWLSTWTAV